MANLKEIRNRITSVNSTMQITSAMKMVSAAKLKRATDAITQMRPYAEKLQDILGNLSASLDSSEGIYSAPRAEKNVLIVTVTSNRGLCGGFNGNVVKSVIKLMEEHGSDNVYVLPVGKKAVDGLKSKKLLNLHTDLPAECNEIWNELDFDNVSVIAETIMKAYRDGVVDKVVVVYNKFVNAAVQQVQREAFLPVVPTESEASGTQVDYIFSPEKESIVNDLIPKSLKVQLYKALLDSHASEHGARMTAMHKATDNAGDLKKELTLHYNKARQASITAEILEIVGGAEALAG
ncbi:MAG: ATP synthase F1 subunit gamma [Thalassobium sp.]|nr:MAG: ATP synthase F1 subunit gamma [Thalassobium sp.]